MSIMQSIEFVCVLLLLLAFAYSNLSHSTKAGVISNTNLSTDIQSLVNNSAVPDSVMKTNNFTNATVLSSGSTGNTKNYNPPFRTCVVEPANQAHSSGALYKILVQAEHIPAIEFGNGSEIDAVSGMITFQNYLTSNHMKGELNLYTGIGYTQIPFTVKTVSTECFSEVGGSQLTKLPQLDSFQLFQYDPPFRECYDRTAQLNIR